MLMEQNKISFSQNNFSEIGRPECPYRYTSRRAMRSRTRSIILALPTKPSSTSVILKRDLIRSSFSGVISSHFSVTKYINCDSSSHTRSFSGQEQTNTAFSFSWIPNIAAVSHWRDPAANNNASISIELETGFPDKNDR